MSDEGEKTCPLCAEEMDLTDQQLKPCKNSFFNGEILMKMYVHFLIFVNFSVRVLEFLFVFY